MAELALSWVKMRSYNLGITSKRAQDPLRIPDAMIDVHSHRPAGAQKEDGPSAGVARVRTRTFCPLRFQFLNRENGQVCAIVSLLTGKCVPPTTVMTGEVRVSGNPHITCSNVMFGPDHAPRTCLTCRWRQRESTGCASCGREQGDRTLGEP